MISSSHKIKKGLDIPLKGSVVQKIDSSKKESKFIALKGRDFIGLKPSFLVKEGEVVKIGQPLFKNKKIDEIVYTSPAGGKVVAINKGERREFLSIVIEVASKEDEVSFKSFSMDDLKKTTKEVVVKQLLKSGQWPIIRRRPFETVANPMEEPKSIFVNAVNSNPYSMDSAVLYFENEDNINAGIEVLSKLTRGDINFCIEKGKNPLFVDNSRVKVHSFEGKHPYGNVGTHIHKVDPVGQNSFVWHLSLSGLIAIGELFLTGRIKLDRLISLGGTIVKNGRLVKTRLGVDTREIVSGELEQEKDFRIISGSVLNGQTATTQEFSYLGFYDNQITVIREEVKRHFLAMNNPGFHLFSIYNIFFSKLIRGRKFDMTTTEYSGQRAIFPVDAYQKVMPLDIEAISILKALASNDVESSIELGVFELAEEDLALCSFVCPGKHDHGSALRKMLNTLEKEG